MPREQATSKEKLSREPKKTRGVNREVMYARSRSANPQIFCGRFPSVLQADAFNDPAAAF
jgi:hypothetical protein